MCTNDNFLVTSYRLFFLALVSISLQVTLRSEPLDVAEHLSWLPERPVQIKIGVIVGDDVFSYDDFHKVEVNYPQDAETSFGKPPVNPVVHSILHWFIGSLTTETVCLASLPTKAGSIETRPIEHTEFRLQWDNNRIQRWYYKDDSFWCVSELIVQFEAGFPYAGAYNEQLPVICRTKYKKDMPDNEVNGRQRSNLKERYGSNKDDDRERAEWVPAFTEFQYGYRNRLAVDETFQRSSFLPPMQRLGPSYDCLSGGFDFLPISRNHWQLCTLIPNRTYLPFKDYFPFTLWEAHSRIMERDGEAGYENDWTVCSQSLLAWGGKFFAVPIKNSESNLPSFYLVRDSSPCYRLTVEDTDKDIQASYAVSGELYRLDIAEEDLVDEERRPWHRQSDPPKEWATREIHCQEPVLDPETHRIIALIYVEPEGKVYGFGKDFYVRLDVLPENGDLATAIISCRDVTQGAVSGPDGSGATRLLGDPFRTVWECSLVLKEDGLVPEIEQEAERFLNPPEPIVLRTWTSANGNFSIEAKYLSSTATIVTLEKANGTPVTVELARLSQNDQDYVKHQQNAEKGQGD